LNVHYENVISNVVKSFAADNETWSCILLVVGLLYCNPLISIREPKIRPIIGPAKLQA
jgi:hypothetical protein